MKTSISLIVAAAIIGVLFASAKRSNTRMEMPINGTKHLDALSGWAFQHVDGIIGQQDSLAEEALIWVQEGKG